MGFKQEYNNVKRLNLHADDYVLQEKADEEICSYRSMFYRFQNGTWNTQGIGIARLLMHRKTRSIQLVFVQDNTSQAMCRHLLVDVSSYCELRPNAGSDKCWEWLAQDYSEGEPRVDRLALKFANSDLANEFKDAFNVAKRF